MGLSWYEPRPGTGSGEVFLGIGGGYRGHHRGPGAADGHEGQVTASQGSGAGGPELETWLDIFMLGKLGQLPSLLRASVSSPVKWERVIVPVSSVTGRFK